MIQRKDAPKKGMPYYYLGGGSGGGGRSFFSRLWSMAQGFLSEIYELKIFNLVNYGVLETLVITERSLADPCVCLPQVQLTY